MKILVDHGSSHNLGDTAMLEAVVARLLRVSEDIEAHVLYRPAVKTRLWDWPRVEPVEFQINQPIPTLWPFWKARCLWRLNKSLAPYWRGYCFASLGRTIQPSNIRVGDGGQDVSLDQWCRPYEGYLSVGGGNLTETFTWELWRRCCFIHAFAAQGKPVILSGQQIGPFRSKALARALGRALGKADFVGLREPSGSMEFCQWADLPPERYALMGDDSFGIGAETTSRVGSYLERMGLPAGDFLAVNARIAAYSNFRKAQVQEVADLLSGLSKRYKMPLVVVPIALNREDSDIQAGHQIAETIGGNRVHVIDDHDLTPAMAKGILGRAFGAVGVSYHFCTFALSQGVPAVCIHHGDYYGQKGRGLSRFWGDENLSLPLGEVTVDQGLDQISSVFDDAELREALTSRASEAVSHWETTFDTRILDALPIKTS